jgi:hypothetical protein
MAVAVPPKCLYRCTKLHSIKSQIIILNVITARTSNTNNQRAIANDSVPETLLLKQEVLCLFPIVGN